MLIFYIPNRKQLQEPYFREVDLTQTTNANFHLGLTDRGLCYVHNGASMNDTYRYSDKIAELNRLFDSRENVLPLDTEGTGIGYQKSFWFHVGDR